MSSQGRLRADEGLPSRGQGRHAAREVGLSKFRHDPSAAMVLGLLVTSGRAGPTLSLPPSWAKIARPPGRRGPRMAVGGPFNPRRLPLPSFGSGYAIPPPPTLLPGAPACP